MGEGMGHYQWGESPNSYSLYLDLLLQRAVDRLDHGGRFFMAQRSVKTLAKIEDILTASDRGPTPERGTWDVRWHCTDLSDVGSLWATQILDGVEYTASVRSDPTSADLIIVVGSTRSHEDAKRRLAGLVATVPPLPKLDASAVPITFWTLTAQGPKSRRRVLTAQSWDEMSGNYPAKAGQALGSLTEWTGPPQGGRLLLLHGPPGTGKTHAIRALAREWRGWCDTHYVVDPERFFGTADYMLNVLLGADSSTPAWDDDDNDDGTSERKPASRWRLIVVEDADELLSVAGKAESGQGMSRLLNVCDGLVGQGLSVLILITTNEPMAQLHPAVVRPGRCLANVEVGKLSVAEANRWFNRFEGEGERPKIGEPKTVADLYEIRKQIHQVNAAAGPTEPGQYL
jgi:hypothetical protein